MKESQHKKETTMQHQPNLCVKTQLKAGYECPPGWWKYKEGKKRMCCHWVYDPYWQTYKVECTE